ncbi:alcohol dehydrogenase catalytic domain-containing protein [Stieleria sp. JC731]|uniref:MDR/zinc-dependent alcohol dehydrogenase-like family protein n=1 Tax=Pirellulaceae TaxID=2691357 RepID=UPI001E4DCD1E|nr:alcohol dehydrogenase catalytic domain-containing protein [Stieleria sp. JC731]MCC9599421.1 alcohol dehydrogenase catalytic domain-containing protein [Stieleria sp. JC731]
MKAITLHSQGFGFDDVYPSPKPKDDETLVRVLKAGICDTDLQLIKGYMGFAGVLGHEFVGVAQGGPYAGQRVVGEINCSCHQCQTCQAGNATHCPNRTVIGIDRHDGAMAEYVAVPQRNLHVIPESVDNDAAVLVEPLAAAFEILDQVDLASTDRVAILGDGRLGFFCAQAISLHTDRLSVFGKHGTKLLRFGHRGFTTIQVVPDDLADLPSREFDVVVDCTGSTSGLPMALHLVRPRGTIVMKTTVADPHHQSLAQIVIDEINLVGSRCGPFAKAINALASLQVDVSGLITDRFELDQANEAFEKATNPTSFKVVFDIGQ